VVLALASLAWSIDPALTSRRLYRLLAIVLVSIAFVLSGWHAARLQSVLRPVVTLVLFASALFAWTVPSLAVHQERAAELAGAWHGLANHKNGLGALACTGLLLWMHAGLAGHARWLSVLTASGLALLCMVMSRSSTAQAAAGLCVSFMVLAMRAPPALRRHTAAWMIGLTLLLLVYALGMLNLVPGSAMLMASISIFSDKAATLTGRTEIWAVLTDHIALRPWLGSGYAAYWTPGPQAGTESYEFMSRMGGFYPGSAHNGYLEVVNDLGGIGLACLMLYAAMHVRQLLRLLRLDAVQATLLMAMFLQQAVTNLSETHWFSVLSVDFVFMTLASTAVARSLLEQRWHAAFGTPGLEVSAAGQKA
jgi:O-antigen ligase